MYYKELKKEEVRFIVILMYQYKWYEWYRDIVAPFKIASFLQPCCTFEDTCDPLALSPIDIQLAYIGPT